MTNEDVLKLLIPSLSNGGSRPWDQYGPAGQQTATVIQYLRQQIQSIAGSFGPLGTLAAPFISDFLVGRDFDKFGRPISQLSGVLAPQGQSYAGAYQTMLRAQQTAALGITAQNFQKQIWQQSAKAYYGLTDSTLTGDALRNKIKGSNFLAPQRVINYFFDPMQREKALKGVRDTMAGSLYWDNRRGVGAAEAVTNARELGQAAKQLVTEANMTILGGQRWKDDTLINKDFQGKDFGGFKGSQVAQLASIIANTSDIMSPMGIKDAITKFKTKVQQTAQAIAPMKDIFGNDMKAMTDTLQAVSGQRVSQMPANLARSLATTIADMSRYANVSPAQIQSMGNNLLTTAVNRQYGDSFSRSGTARLGGLAAAITANGNTPAGIHVGEYVGDVNQRLSQVNNTKGADWLAKAYAVWKQKNKGGTLQQFQGLVQQSRAGGRNLMEAAMNVAGVSYLPQLNAGATSVYYRQAKTSGKMGQMALQGQFQDALLQQSWAVGNDTRIGRSAAEQGRRALSAMSAEDLKYLAQHNQDPEAIQTIVKKYNKLGFNINADTLGGFLTGDMLKVMHTTATARQARQFSIKQEALRTRMKELQKVSGGSWNTLFLAMANPKSSAQIMPKLTEDDRKLFYQVAFDAKTEEEGKERMKALNEGLGTQRAARVFQNLMTSKASDAGYKEAVKKVASKDKTERAQGLRYLKASQIIDLSGSKNMAQLMADQEYAKDVDQALYGLQNLTGQARTKGVLDAQKKLRDLGIKRKINKADAKQLGLNADTEVAKTQRETLLANVGKDIQEIKASKDASTWAGFRSKDEMLESLRKAQSGFDAKSDIQSRIVTVLEKLLDWLKKTFPDT